MLNNLGDYLKSIRNDRSYREMERLTGLSHVYWITLERGVDPRNGKIRKPSLEALKELSRTLNVDIAILLEKVGFTDLLDARHEIENLKKALDKILELEDPNLEGWETDIHKIARKALGISEKEYFEMED